MWVCAPECSAMEARGALTSLWHEHWEPNLSPGQDQAVLGTADYVPAPVAALLNDSYTSVRATIFTQSQGKGSRGEVA